jgi:uncharacterized membrane protein
LLSRIPAYAIVKGMTASFAEAEGATGMKPVVARLDDYGQVAFEIERLAHGDVVVYLPGAPNPWSGAVCVMAADRIIPVEATMAATVASIRRLGMGSNALLAGTPSYGRTGA